MKKRIYICDVVMNSFMLFSVLTVLQGISGFEAINKIWMMVAGAMLVFEFFLCKYNVQQLAIVFVTLVLHIFAFAFTDGKLVSINIVFYFALWVLYYMFFSKRKDEIIERFSANKVFYDGILIVWTVLVGFSAIIPSCYEDGFFYSFAGHSFRLLPSALIILALAMYMAIKTGLKRYNFFLVLPMYAAFMGSSRTYFGVMLVFMIMYIYMVIENKSLFYISLIPLCVVILFLTSVGSISDKIAMKMYTQDSYFDFWGTITSGRTVFWQWDIEAFLELPIWQQFVGNGFNFVYDVNGSYMEAIWAHNDFINVLMNFGYIGVVVYTWSFYMLVSAFWKGHRNIPLPVKLLFLCAVFINSMMNMSYTYLCAMVSYPVFLCSISEKYSSEDLQEEEDKNRRVLSHE